MSAKNEQAVIALMEILEARFSLQVIWALRDGHPQTFRLLQSSVGIITPNTLNARLKELRSAELVFHDGSGYTLTRLGKAMVASLQGLTLFSKKWAGRPPVKAVKLTQMKKVVKEKEVAAPIEVKATVKASDKSSKKIAVKKTTSKKVASSGGRSKK